MCFIYMYYVVIAALLITPSRLQTKSLAKSWFVCFEDVLGNLWHSNQMLCLGEYCGPSLAHFRCITFHHLMGESLTRKIWHIICRRKFILWDIPCVKLTYETTSGTRVTYLPHPQSVRILMMSFPAFIRLNMESKWNVCVMKRKLHSSLKIWNLFSGCKTKFCPLSVRPDFHVPMMAVVTGCHCAYSNNLMYLIFNMTWRSHLMLVVIQ